MPSERGKGRWDQADAHDRATPPKKKPTKVVVKPKPPAPKPKTSPRDNDRPSAKPPAPSGRFGGPRGGAGKPKPTTRFQPKPPGKPERPRPQLRDTVPFPKTPPRSAYPLPMPGTLQQTWEQQPWQPRLPKSTATPFDVQRRSPAPHLPRSQTYLSEENWASYLLGTPMGRDQRRKIERDNQREEAQRRITKRQEQARQREVNRAKREHPRDWHVNLLGEGQDERDYVKNGKRSQRDSLIGMAAPAFGNWVEGNWRENLGKEAQGYREHGLIGGFGANFARGATDFKDTLTETGDIVAGKSLMNLAQGENTDAAYAVLQALALPIAGLKGFPMLATVGYRALMGAAKAEKAAEVFSAGMKGVNLTRAERANLLREGVLQAPDKVRASSTPARILADAVDKAFGRNTALGRAIRNDPRAPRAFTIKTEAGERDTLNSVYATARIGKAIQKTIDRFRPEHWGKVGRTTVGRIFGDEAKMYAKLWAKEAQIREMRFAHAAQQIAANVPKNWLGQLDGPTMYALRMLGNQVSPGDMVLSLGDMFNAALQRGDVIGVAAHNVHMAWVKEAADLVQIDPITNAVIWSGNATSKQKRLYAAIQRGSAGREAVLDGLDRLSSAAADQRIINASLVWHGAEYRKTAEYFAEVLDKSPNRKVLVDRLGEDSPHMVALDGMAIRWTTHRRQELLNEAATLRAAGDIAGANEAEAMAARGVDPDEFYAQLAEVSRNASPQEMEELIARYGTDVRFRIKDKGNPFAFDEKTALTNAERRRKVNRGEIVFDHNNERVLDKNGLPVVGRITFEERARRLLLATPTQEQRLKDAVFYNEVEPLFQRVFNDEEILAWLASQVGASPARGVLDLLKVLEAVREGIPIPAEGPGSIGLVAHAMRDILQGKTGLSKGAQAKISDFVDSALHKTTRTWTGDAADAGRPFVADRWLARADGLVDKEGLGQLEREFGLTGLELDLIGDGLSDIQYELVAKSGEDFTNFLNGLPEGFDGRKDWQPYEIQAMEWAGIQRYWGDDPEDITFALNAYTHTASIPLDIEGKSAPRLLKTIEADVRALIDSDPNVKVNGLTITPSVDGRALKVGLLTHKPEAANAAADRLAAALGAEKVIVTRRFSGPGAKRSLTFVSPALRTPAAQARFMKALAAESPEIQGLEWVADSVKGKPALTVFFDKGAVSTKAAVKNKDGVVVSPKVPVAEMRYRWAKEFEDAVNAAQERTGIKVDYGAGSHSVIKGGKRGSTEAGLAGRPGELDDPLAAVLGERYRDAVEAARAGRAGRAGVDSGQAEGVLAREGSGRPELSFTQTTDYTAFNDALRRNPRPWFLTEHTPEELADSKVFLSPDGESGFVLSAERDLQNVFRNPDGVPGSGREAVKTAIREGAATLDAYDGFLPDFYQQEGFQIVGRMKWVDEFAPPGWPYDEYGRPDVLFMAYNPPPGTEVKTFTDWDEAKGYSQRVAEPQTVKPEPKVIHGFFNPEANKVAISDHAPNITALHEFVHRALATSTKHPNNKLFADEFIDKLAKHVGVVDGNWTKAKEERAVALFEAVLLDFREGTSKMDPKLVKAFEAIRQEMVAQEKKMPGLYGGATDELLAGLPDDLRESIEDIFWWIDESKEGFHGARRMSRLGQVYLPETPGMPAGFVKRNIGGQARAIRKLAAGVEKLQESDDSLKHMFTGALIRSGRWDKDITKGSIQSVIKAGKIDSMQSVREHALKIATEIPPDAPDLVAVLDDLDAVPAELAKMRKEVDTAKQVFAKFDSGKKISEQELDKATVADVERLRDYLFLGIDGKNDELQALAASIRRGAIKPIPGVKWIRRETLIDTDLFREPYLRPGSGVQKLVSGADALNNALKMAVLSGNPAYYPMNMMGQAGLLAVQQLGLHRPMFPLRAARLRVQLGADAAFLDLIGGVGQASVLRSPGGAGKQVVDAFADVGNFLIDKYPRGMAVMYEAQRLGYRNAEQLRSLMFDPRYVDDLKIVMERSRKAMVDFNNLSQFEKEVISRLIFVYPWLKASTYWTARFPLDHPFQAALFAAGLYLQQQRLREYFPDGVPGYMDFALPIKANEDSVYSFRLDQLLPPFQTVDVAKQIAAGIGGDKFQAPGLSLMGGEEGLSSMLQPLISAALNTLAGQDTFTGQPVEQSIVGFFSQLDPRERIVAYKKIMDAIQGADSSLYPMSKFQEWLRVFTGSLTPINVDPDVAAQRGARVSGDDAKAEDMEWVDKYKKMYGQDPSPHVLAVKKRDQQYGQYERQMYEEQGYRSVQARVAALLMVYADNVSEQDRDAVLSQVPNALRMDDDTADEWVSRLRETLGLTEWGSTSDQFSEDYNEWQRRQK